MKPGTDDRQRIEVRFREPVNGIGLAVVGNSRLAVKGGGCLRLARLTSEVSCDRPATFW